MGAPRSNPDLADALIEQLNQLIEDPAVRDDIAKLLRMTTPVSEATLGHPTLQCGDGTLSPLGMLNGICGVIEGDGPKKGWGFIAACFDYLEPEKKTMRLARFVRTDAPEVKPCDGGKE